MPHIHIPADLGLEPLVRQLRTLGLEPDDTCADGALMFRWRRPRPGEGSNCAHPGCTRPGAVRWHDDDATYCADHAHTERPGAALEDLRDAAKTPDSLHAQIDALANMERVCREQLGHYRNHGQAGLAAEAESDLADIHDRQAALQAQLERLTQGHAA